MKTISYWAKAHKWQSRLLIILIYILLNIIGMFTGKLLQEIGVNLPPLYFTCCVIFTIAAWIMYPSSNATQGKTSPALYFRRKLFDFSFGAVTFLMIVHAGNNWQHLFTTGGQALAAKIIPVKRVSASENTPHIRKFIAEIKSMDVKQLSEREKLRLIKKQVKAINHDKNTSDTGKALLIGLSVIVALGLLYGLAGLSCSISCGGSEALAIIVAVLGTALIIFLLVRVIKSITRGRVAPPKVVT